MTAAARRAVLLTSVLAASAWTTTAQAADQEGIFVLYLNTVESGEVHAVLRNGDVLVARADLEAAGLRGFQATEIEVKGQKLISLESVRPALRFVIDEQEIALRVDAPVELFPSQYFDLSAPPKDISYARRRSVFLNYAPRVTLSSGSHAVGGAFLESGFSESNRLWYSSVSGSTETGAARGLSSVTFDDKPKMRRLTVGDTTVAAGPIGGAAVIGGVTFARDFTLDPYFLRFPTTRFTSATSLPARVDVYVNGVRVRTESLQPGAFTLDSLRGLAGAGTVRYVLRDVLGREQMYSLPYYIGPTVLAKGVDDYAVSAGLPRNAVGIESFDYQTPAMIGYYRRGIRDWLTIGGRAEARWERMSGGPVVATATPLGLFELEAAASFAEGGRGGAAGIFSYQYLGRYFSTGASVRALTNEYATVSLASSTDRSTFQASTFVSLPLGERASFSTQTAVDVRRDLPTFARVSGLTQIKVARDLSLLVEAALVSTEPPKAWLDTFAVLSWTPDSNLYASAGARTTSGVAGANVQVSKPASYGRDWSMAAALDVSDETRASVNHRLQTAANTVSTYFDWRPEGATLSAEPAGSMVWVQGGGLFFTRPIFDSFALVRVPKVENVRVYLNSQEVDRTNEHGYALVPSMISYYGSQIGIATDDVPLDRTLETDLIVAAPPRRGAAYVEFSAPRIHYYRGRLRLVRAGAETIPLFGELSVMNAGTELVSPIGQDGTFELEGLSSGKHDAELRYEADRCRFSFDAPDTDAALIDLGTLRCTLP